MTERKISRRRGTILTPAGYQKLQTARHQAEQVANFGDQYTREELSRLTGLSLKTIAKIFTGAPTVDPARQISVDKQTLDLCFAAFNLKLERRDYLYPDGVSTNDVTDDRQLDRTALVTQLASPLPPHQLCRHDTSIDCGEAPDVSVFYGREVELAQLAQWVNDDRCRLIAILGMGGIGKTALVTKLAQQIQSNFTAIVWRSLRNAPLLSNLLPEIIQVFSHQTETVPPTMDISTQISRLFHYFCKERCLLILDNAEAILPSQIIADSVSGAATVENRYLDYAELFRRIGESRHQSCLLLTSREKPEVIVPLEGEQLFVRTFALHGLNASESEHLFDDKGLSASSVGRARLREIYSGNPLALNIVATSICDLFDGDIDQFLEAEVSIFSGIQQLLDRQFDRLSSAEQQVMYWLAIEREWVSPADLHAQIVPATTKSRLLATLESLGWKSLIEHSGGKFTQQAVVMEYMTARLIDRVSSELTNWDIQAERPQNLPLWLSLPLMEAQAPEYLHAIQTRLILEPISSQLQLQFGNKSAVARHLRSILASLQTDYRGTLHYGGGNLINLLRYLHIDLTGYDFADLPMWQADFQGAELHNVNFHGADLSKSVFTQTFGWISAVGFSPDSQLLATGESGGDLCLWQVGNKRLFDKFTAHPNRIWAIAFSPDGQILASAGQDATIRLWDVATRRVIHVLQVDNHQVLSLSFHPDGHSLATGHGNGELRLWNLLTGKLMSTQSAHSPSLFSVRFSPDGKLLATGSNDKTVKIWDVPSPGGEATPTALLGAGIIGNCLRTLTAHRQQVFSVRFSPDGKLLATGSSDGTIQLWQIATWTIVAVLPVYSNWLFSIDFSPDSQLLAVGNSNYEVKIWDVRSQPNGLPSRSAIATLRGHHALVSSIQFSPDGKLLVTAGADRSIRLWDTRSWQELHHWQGYTNQVESVAFAPDGTQFVSGSQDGIVRVWDVQTGDIRQTLTGHQQGIWSVDCSPNGRSIASASADGMVKLWDLQTGKLLQTLLAHQGDIWQVKFSPDGRLIATSGMDNTICLWMVTGELVATWLGHIRLVRSIAFSPDSKLLATGSFDSCWRLWDVTTQELLGCYCGHTNWIWNVAFSPDGRFLASCSADRTIKIWAVATGKLLQTFEGHTLEVLAVKFSPNGRELATSSGDRSIKIWDIETGKVLQSLTGHLNRVLSLSYSPDGKLLASGSADETVKLWDVTTGDCLQTYKPLPPYAGMNITGVTGLTATTIESLKTLGAIS